MSVDPGVWQCGVAWWAGGHLVRAELVRAHRGEGATYPGARRYLASRILPLDGEALAIEMPQVYARGKSKGDPNDLINLAAVVGAISSRFLTVTEYRPREWKGQTPKEVTEARMWAALSEEEKARIVACPKSLAHNVYDAIALGLAHFKKIGVRQ